jgi:hypothetical protein
MSARDHQSVVIRPLLWEARLIRVEGEERIDSVGDGRDRVELEEEFVGSFESQIKDQGVSAE